MPLMVDEAGNLWDQGPDGKLAFQGKEGAPKPSVVEDVIKSAPGIIPRAASSLIGLPQNLADLGAAGLEKLGVPNPKIPDFQLANAGDVAKMGWDKIFEATTGKPMVAPQTPRGKIVNAMAEGALTGGAVGPAGRVGTAMASGAGGGAGSELAANFMGDTPTNRIIGSLIGGTAAGLGPSAVQTFNPWSGSRGQSSAARSLQGVTPAEFGQAKSTMEEAGKQGVNLTAAQALPRETPLLGVHQKLLSHPATGGDFSAFLGKQTPTTETASRGITGAVSPTAGGAPAQKAAEEAIEAGRKFRTNVTAPEFAITRGNQIQSNADMAKLRTDLTSAVRQVGPTTEAGKFIINRLMRPTDGVRDVDEISSILLTAKEQLRNKKFIDQNSITRSVQADISKGLDAMDNHLAQFQVNRPAGNQLYSQITEDVIKPQEKGLLGQMAKGKQETAVIELLNNTDKIRAQSILETANKMAKQDPAAFPALVRANWERQLEKAIPGGGGFSDPRAAAKFADTIYGAEGQLAKRENFRAMVAGAARSQGVPEAQVAEAVRDAESVMNTLRASGRGKGGMGSALTESGSGEQVMGRLGLGMKPSVGVRGLEAVSNWFTAATHKELLKLLTSGPEGLDKLREIAGRPGVAGTTAKVTGVVSGEEAR